MLLARGHRVRRSGDWGRMNVSSNHTHTGRRSGLVSPVDGNAGVASRSACLGRLAATEPTNAGLLGRMPDIAAHSLPRTVLDETFASCPDGARESHDAWRPNSPGTSTRHEAITALGELRRPERATMRPCGLGRRDLRRRGQHMSGIWIEPFHHAAHPVSTGHGRNATFSRAEVQPFVNFMSILARALVMVEHL